MNPLYQKDILSKTTKIIEEHLADVDFTLEELCRKVGYSYPHLHRIIKVETGLTLSLYVRQQRLLAAIALLAETSFNIAQVSFAVGFKDPNYFARVFRLEYGLSPKEWRVERNYNNA